MQHVPVYVHPPVHQMAVWHTLGRPVMQAVLLQKYILDSQPVQ